MSVEDQLIWIGTHASVFAYCVKARRVPLVFFFFLITFAFEATKNLKGLCMRRGPGRVSGGLSDATLLKFTLKLL